MSKQLTSFTNLGTSIAAQDLENVLSSEIKHPYPPMNGYEEKYPQLALKKDSHPYPFISMLGIIGSGKTSLAEEISKKTGLSLFREKVEDNPLLPPFYENMDRFSWPLQISLLNDRSRQQQKLAQSETGSIQDRSIYEDAIFVRTFQKQGTWSEYEVSVYNEMAAHVLQYLKKPDVIIFLDVPAEVALQRIRKRGREMEKNIDIEYLTALRDQYLEWVHQHQNTLPILTVKWEFFSLQSESIAFILDQLNTGYKNLYKKNIVFPSGLVIS